MNKLWICLGTINYGNKFFFSPFVGHLNVLLKAPRVTVKCLPGNSAGICFGKGISGS